jgi:hypothetical protein
VEPPYNGSHYGRPYRNVGITVVSDNQIIQISVQQAKFRLGQGPSPRAKSTTKKANGKETIKPTNADIMEQIRSGNGYGAGPTASITPPLSTKQPTPSTQTTTPQSRNQAILQGVGSKSKRNTDTFIAEVLQCPRVTSI